MSNIFRQLRQRFMAWWSRRSRATQTLPQYIISAIGNFGRYGSSYSAALSYYAVFSLFPLILLVAILFNQILGQTITQEQIAQGLSFFLPTDAITVLQETVLQAFQQSGQFTIIGLIGLIWSGLGLFANLTKTVEFIFHKSTTSNRNPWQQRLTAVIMAVVLLLLILMSFMTSGLLRLIATLLGTYQLSWLSLAVILVPYSFNLLVYVLLLRYVPRVKVYWEAIWVAAIFGAAGWELSKALFIWYLENIANIGVVYGGIAAVIILLLSAYLTSAVLVFSLELCSQINIWYEDNFVVKRIILPERRYNLIQSKSEK